MASASKIAATDAKLESIKPNANSSLRCCPNVTVSIQIFLVSLTKNLALLSVETVFFFRLPFHARYILLIFLVE